MRFNDVFTQKNSLSSKFWYDDRLEATIKGKLMIIAQDFFDNLGLDDVEVNDITFTGSLANFNYTKYSDIDLHLLVDFAKIDENSSLVREYFRAKASLWNQKHKISIRDHEVEIYVQDSAEEHYSSGVYSVMNDEWLVKPSPKVLKHDEEVVEKKVNSFIEQIQDLEDLYSDKKFKQAHDFAEKMIQKIKKFRQSGLEADGEQSNENLTFKWLRNHDFIKELHDMRTDSYDRMMSLNGKYHRKFKIYIDQEEEEERKGFYRLDEIEEFQQKVMARHNRLKEKNIGGGYQKTGSAYPQKPNYERGKSAPPIGESYNA